MGVANTTHTWSRPLCTFNLQSYIIAHVTRTKRPLSESVMLRVRAKQWKLRLRHCRAAKCKRLLMVTVWATCVCVSLADTPGGEKLSKCSETLIANRWRRATGCTRPHSRLTVTLTPFVFSVCNREIKHAAWRGFHTDVAGRHILAIVLERNVCLSQTWLFTKPCAETVKAKLILWKCRPERCGGVGGGGVVMKSWWKVLW